jgi:branched-chain amino acid transport system ATP-binding protein
MALLAVDALEKRFGGLPAVDGVTFGVDEGQILAVVGPNGAGKSTLLKIIGGLERPSAGSVTLAGERVDGLATHRVRHKGIAVVMQTPLVFGSMTTLENVVLGAGGNPARGGGAGLRRPRRPGQAARREPQSAPAALPRAGQGAGGPAAAAAHRRGDGRAQRRGADRVPPDHPKSP